MEEEPGIEFGDLDVHKHIDENQLLREVSIVQVRKFVIELLKNFPRKQAIAFVLRFWYGYSYQEIADDIGKSKSETMYLIQSALSRIRIYERKAKDLNGLHAFISGESYE